MPLISPPPMLRQARKNQRLHGWKNVSPGVGRQPPDARSRSGWADFAIEGWASCRSRVWHPAMTGRTSSGAHWNEMHRIVSSGGRLILIETLGTGESTPTVIPFFPQRL